MMIMIVCETTFITKFLQKNYVFEVVKVAYSKSGIAQDNEEAMSARTKSKLRPQGVAWATLIDLHYLPVVMTADYNTEGIKALGLSQKSSIYKQKDAVWMQNGTKYIISLVSDADFESHRVMNAPKLMDKFFPPNISSAR